jgi:predicted nucleic acid-binding protein
MPGTFVDTSGWGHLVDPTQAFHSQAASLYRQARQQGARLVTTNYILTELVALLTSPVRLPRARVIEFISSLKASPYVDIIHIDAQLDSQAWDLLVERPDKEWSLVDCASFVVMRQAGIAEALTTDRHFEQAGFVRLLKA